LAFLKIGAETDAQALVGKLRDQLHGPDHDRLTFRASRRMLGLLL
jgi:hypothetical protein